MAANVTSTVTPLRSGEAPGTGSTTTVPPSTCQVTPAIQTILTPGYVNESHQSEVGELPRYVMDISATNPSGTKCVVW
jgi:hypothetical protein